MHLKFGCWNVRSLIDSSRPDAPHRKSAIVAAELHQEWSTSRKKEQDYARRNGCNVIVHTTSLDLASYAQSAGDTAAPGSDSSATDECTDEETRGNFVVVFV